MKIAVIAAGGRSGSLFVETALVAGHSIRAGVHSNNPLKPHPNLTVIHCDATNSKELRELLSGQEAVASFIGHGPDSPASVQTTAIQKTTNAMKELGIRRIVSLTGTGVYFPGDTFSLIDRLLNLGIKVIDRSRLVDGKNHVKVLEGSGLDWTVIRVLKLQDFRESPFELRIHGPTKWYTSRQEAAEAVLQVLEQDSFIRQAPIIGRT
jgi:hypothetical protein